MVRPGSWGRSPIELWKHGPVRLPQKWWPGSMVSWSSITVTIGDCMLGLYLWNAWRIHLPLHESTVTTPTTQISKHSKYCYCFTCINFEAISRWFNSGFTWKKTFYFACQRYDPNLIERHAASLAQDPCTLVLADTTNKLKSIIGVIFIETCMYILLVLRRANVQWRRGRDSEQKGMVLRERVDHRPRGYSFLYCVG